MKRAFDIVASALGLVVLSPMFVILSILIWRDMGRPILFRQVRPGRGGAPFMLLKFRTMRDALSTDGTPLPDSERITRLGQILRSTSLDEFPELWNVLKGEMSLVGPRPLLIEYLPLFSEEQARRHEVRPGITGWAQVNGRNGLAWADKFALDRWYVDNHSLWLDLKILWQTVRKVLVRDGISADGEVTMPRFDGTITTLPKVDEEGRLC